MHINLIYSVVKFHFTVFINMGTDKGKGPYGVNKTLSL